MRSRAEIGDHRGYYSQGGLANIRNRAGTLVRVTAASDLIDRHRITLIDVSEV